MPQLLPDMLIQDAIAASARNREKVQETFGLQEKSKQLLEIAQIMVERAILKVK